MTHGEEQYLLTLKGQKLAKMKSAHDLTHRLFGALCTLATPEERAQRSPPNRINFGSSCDCVQDQNRPDVVAP